jgi:hypothetical protein
MAIGSSTSRTRTARWQHTANLETRLPAAPRGSQGVTASFKPASLTPGSGATSVDLTIQTAQASAAVRPLPPWFATPAVLLRLLLPLFGISRARRMLRYRARFLTADVSLGMVLAIAGCTGVGFFSQPPKTCTITVTATSGTLQHSTTVDLTVWHDDRIAHRWQGARANERPNLI